MPNNLIRAEITSGTFHVVGNSAVDAGKEQDPDQGQHSKETFHSECFHVFFTVPSLGGRHRDRKHKPVQNGDAGCSSRAINDASGKKWMRRKSSSPARSRLIWFARLPGDLFHDFHRGLPRDSLDVN